MKGAALSCVPCDWTATDVSNARFCPFCGDDLEKKGVLGKKVPFRVKLLARVPVTARLRRLASIFGEDKR